MNYPNKNGPATPSLREKLLAELSQKGSLPFPAFMEMALYDPEQGYYASGTKNVGREGDFFTSVSVGPLFGQLLAVRFANWWKNNGQPSPWRILEIGANDGKLAADILATLRSKFPHAFKSLQYAIAEPLPTLADAQKNRLEESSVNLLIANSLAEIATTKLPGIAFGNEILDALPFHLVRMENGDWKELHVSSKKNSELTLVPHLIPSESTLSKHLGKMEQSFPEAYQTEIRTCFPEFLHDVSACLTHGLLLFFDYGFASEEYFHPSRTAGTLRTYSKHKAGEDPLEKPGEFDITAHVNFTDLAVSAKSVGYFPTSFSSQSSYLTHLAKPLILSGGMNDPKTIRQFQTLIHPAHLGEKFHVIELEQKSEIPDHVRHRLAMSH